MILRSLKSGLLATVAVLAFLPTAAGSTAASAASQHPVPGAVARDDAHHRTHHHATHRHHRRHAHRVHSAHRLAPQGAVYRSFGQSMAYRLSMHMAPYRLQYRLAAQPVAHRHLPPVTGRVATRHLRLNVRSGPGTGYRVIGHRQKGRHLTLICRTHGSWVHGNRTWYRLPHHAGYVSAHYVRANRTVPWC
ncbi:SH3 domain-containing protein [Streptomyces sp. NPDC052101]|uniref:SH3 domain-containing protein n=1 Tax=Streptomyces sp. NPDC052101 TaxID=3155763 RepID=UPI003440CCEE